ncbi:MAG: prenyltransferase/squalene oxidase repeat-containing protein [Phycisphaerae bacterium]
MNCLSVSKWCLLRRTAPLRRSVVGVCARCAVLATVCFGWSQTTMAARNASNFVAGQASPLRDEITPRVRQSVARGLQWLTAQQAANGSFAPGPMAITALGGLALIAGGNLPGQGPYARNVSHALRYVLNHCQRSGLIVDATDADPMYSQGFATLFLAEIYGESRAPGLHEKLQRAVRLIINAQNAQGGWRYQPVPMDADISVTICQVMALRAAREAGIAVPKRVITKAISFVHRLQDADGGFSYMLNMPGSAFPRSAAGVAALLYAGIYQGSAIGNGVHYLMQCLPGTPANNQGNYFYGNYYATQAMFLAGGKYWARWWPAMRRNLIQRQQSSGNWTGGAGQSYATAMALIILQIPDRYLPILQK